MKDQYFGDINDYRKYALLRSLTHARLSLGVIWMRTADDTRTDGRHIGYLDKPQRWRSCDPPLFDLLADAVARGRRRLSVIERSRLLGDTTAFHRQLLCDDARRRERYFHQALAALADRDVLFLDPDNGMAVPTTRPGRAGSRKYLYDDEVRSAWTRGHSLVIYQHFPRRQRSEYLAELLQRLAASTSDHAGMWAVYKGQVAFITIAQPPHAQRVQAARRQLMKQWGDELLTFAPAD